jgi:6-phosphogluconolactonase
MPWDNLDLYWVDERCVPPDDNDSNYRMTREAMLDHVPLRPEQIHRIEGELEPEAAAARYESELRNSFRLEGAEIPRFDSSHWAWARTATPPRSFRIPRPFTSWAASPSPTMCRSRKDAWRVTLTWPVINHASSVFFLIAGADKAAVLKEVLDRPARPGTAAQSTHLARKRYTYADSGSGCRRASTANDGEGCGFLERER